MQLNAKNLHSLVKSFYKKGFLSLLSANFFTQLVAFFALMYAATVLSPADIGRIKIMQAFVAITAILAGLGTPTAILKLCGEVKSHDEKSYILSKSLRLATLGSFVVYLLFSILIYFNLISEDLILNQAMQLFGLIILPFTLTRVLISFLQATKLFNQLSKIQLINGIVMLISVVGLTYYYNFSGFIYGSLVGTSISLGIFLLLVSSKKAPYDSRRTIHNPFKLIWEYAKYPLWGNIVGQMILYFDLFLINYFVADRSEIGQYGMAVTFVGALHLLTATTQQIVTPYFAEKSNVISEVNSLYKKYITGFVLFSLVVFLASQVAMPIILKLFFANKYDDSIVFFRILSLAWLVKSTYALIGPVFIGIGKTKLSFYGATGSFALSIGFYFYLVNAYGLIGAALGTLTLTVVTAVVLNIIYYSKIIKSHQV